MNLHKRLALTLGAAALLGLTAAGASAQTMIKATFTLPTAAYWNNNLLQPGDYNLSLDKTNTGVELVYLRGEGVNAVFFTPAGSDDSSGHSCLKLEDVNGTYVIRQFDEGPIGRSYTFDVPKAVRNQTLRGAVAPPVTVMVSAAAGM
jgi:hypothetical protein